MVEVKDGIELLYQDGTVRRVARADVLRAIDKLESVGGWHVKAQLHAIGSPLDGCDYDAIAKPFLNHVDLSDPRFMDSRGYPAKTRPAFVLALRNALVQDAPDPDGFTDSAEALIAMGVVQRYVRDSVKARLVKSWYEYRCQLDCDPLDLPERDVDYVEGAHIQPLGGGHKGHDRTENLLSLCPNHHVLFDYGAMYIDVEYRAHWHPSIDGRAPLPALRRHSEHAIGPEYLEYHRREIARVE